ncbi:MAG: TonB-dependent receptor [Bacteroidales bacterium]|nr:TonB-dependent receptor [Bacteroidales bacterium]MCF8456376.1 TonB-dependent receptor [Bacteroidales bacterium]
MRLLIYAFIIGWLCINPTAQLHAENEGGEKTKMTVSGTLKDATNGEDLLGATIFIKELQTGTVTNMYGFYSLSLNPGTYTFTYSYIGYESIEKKIDLRQDVVLNLEMSAGSEQLSEVEVTGERANHNITRSEMSTVKMQMKEIRQIPALMGEVDIIKAIQLLPGVQAVSEGSSGFSVRGGSADQNLIQLDEAPVYNASHLMGFFSVFNNDAIKDVKLYKGDIPASSGGRLASLLDVRMKDGNAKKFSGTGGIGTISSRLTLENPIGDKGSFIVSGRRTYADIFLLFAKDKALRKSTLYFYDLNAKANYQLGENDRLYLSGYMGRDAFGSEFFMMGFGNQTFSARWNHLFSRQLFSNTTVIYSKYDYSLGVPEGGANSFEWTSHLQDYSAKIDFGYYPNSHHNIKFGVASTYHTFAPGTAKGIGDETFFNTYSVPDMFAIESGIYASNEQKVGALLTLKYGIRYSIFQNIGKGTFYEFDTSDPQEYVVTQENNYKKGDVFKTYSGFEPRVGINYQLTEKSSIKTSYSRTRQYIHLAQNSTAGTPLDIWFPSSPNVKPQIADQVALGYFRNFKNNMIEASAEVYYKKMDNAIDFKDHAELLLNDELEGELRFGEAEAYGVEFLFRLNHEKLNGWISYTFSHTERTIPEINIGKSYLAPYDKPHDVSIVLNYNISKRLTASANWVYSTGSPVTFPVGRFEQDGAIVPVYSERNEFRMPDNHRLDLGVTLKGKEKPGRKWQGEWNFSVYNAYARKNAWAISFIEDEENPGETYAEMTYLFSIIPSVTYNFKF